MTHHPDAAREKWRRLRFRTRSADDPRPVTFPPPGPYWISGYGSEGEQEFAVIIAFMPANANVSDFWPESDGPFWDGYSCQWHDEITFTDRFPKPDWWCDTAAPTRDLGRGEG